MPSPIAHWLPLVACLHGRRRRRSGVSRVSLGGSLRSGLTGGAAFTLLEVLLAIAIIALLGGVLVGGASHLLTEKPVTATDVFWKAVREARKTALKVEHEVRLKFDKEKKRFVLLDGLAPSQLAADGFTREEVPLKEFPVVSAPGTDLDVTFLSAGKGGPTILVGGMLLESQPLAFVTFYSDGTCSAFRAQFLRDGAASVHSIDPWTCAPVLAPADPNAPPS